MALNTKMGNAAVNAEADALAALCNTGYIRIYDGAQPASCDTAVTTQNLLAELRFGATAFGAAAAGVITANTIAAVVAALTGTAAWFRVLKSDGTTPLFDGSVGTATANMILGTVSIVQNAQVSISSLVHTVPK